MKEIHLLQIRENNSQSKFSNHRDARDAPSRMCLSLGCCEDLPHGEYRAGETISPNSSAAIRSVTESEAHWYFAFRVRAFR